MASKVIRTPKLIVFNLAWSIGSKELRNYFSKYGPVAFADVKFDRATGFSRGYGFVEMVNGDDLAKVLNEANHYLEGSVINIKRSENN